MVALDTNIVVDYLRNKEDIVHRVEQIERIYLPVVVCGELIFGASISGNPTKHLEKIEAFIQRCTVLNQNMAVAEVYAQIRKRLKEKGTPIPENDLWIAATALSHGLKLVTQDQHFRNVDLIDLEIW